MIIEKDGQIIVTELRPMSDAPKTGKYILVIAKSSGHDDLVFAKFKKSTQQWKVQYFDRRLNGDELIGWLPAVIYQPQQKLEPVYLECGE